MAEMLVHPAPPALGPILADLTDGLAARAERARLLAPLYLAVLAALTRLIARFDDLLALYRAGLLPPLPPPAPTGSTSIARVAARQAIRAAAAARPRRTRHAAPPKRGQDPSPALLPARRPRRCAASPPAPRLRAIPLPRACQHAISQKNRRRRPVPICAEFVLIS